MTAQILEGVRVFDLSIVTAGAGCTQVLADFGAEVIKIESEARPDLFRGWYNPESGEGDLGGSGFRTVNRNKKGFGLDLKNPEGLAVAKRLIAECDIVVENFRQGVLDRLGLGFDELVKIRPDITLVSVSSQGTTGPDSEYGSFGTVLEALGGAMTTTGYDEEHPLWSSVLVNYPDQTATLLGVPLVIMGLMAARASGEARWIDMSQREMVTALYPEAVLASSFGAADPSPQRNHSYGTFGWATQCAGVDHWVAISLEDDADRAAIVDLVGATAIADDEALMAAVYRWSMTRERAEVAAELQLRGIAAAPVMRGFELHDDPYFREINYFVAVEREGFEPELQRGWIVRFDDDADSGTISRRAPHLGEHTKQIMTDLLGYTEDDVERLAALGAISYPTSKARQAT